MRSIAWVLLAFLACSWGCATEPESSAEKIWVRVRKVELAGIEAERAADLLKTPVRVSPVADGFVEPRPDLNVVAVELGKLPGEDDRGRMVNGAVIEGSMRALRRKLASSDQVGARVSFLRSDLEALRRGGGALVFQVELPEPPEADVEADGTTEDPAAAPPSTPGTADSSGNDAPE